jgi:hypothetical protein
MSDTNKKPTIYVPGTFVKEVKFENGGSVIRLSINLEKFAPFVKEHKKSDGYINFNIYPRKETGTYGDTHSVSLDEWVPNKDKAAPKKAPVSAKKQVAKAAPVEQPEVPENGDF